MVYMCACMFAASLDVTGFYENHGQAAPSSTLLYKVIVKVIQQVVAPWLRCHPTLPPRCCLYLSVFAGKVFFWKLRQPLERSFCCSILWAKFLANVSFTQKSIMHPCANTKNVRMLFFLVPVQIGSLIWIEVSDVTLWSLETQQEAPWWWAS